MSDSVSQEEIPLEGRPLTILLLLRLGYPPSLIDGPSTSILISPTETPWAIVVVLLLKYVSHSDNFKRDEISPVSFLSYPSPTFHSSAFAGAVSILNFLNGCTLGMDFESRASFLNER